MFGLRDDVEQELDALCDAGVVLNIRVEQARFNAREDVIWAWCHAPPAVGAELGARQTHWGGCGPTLSSALNHAVLKWMHLVRR